MSLKPISKQIIINAPASKVWDILFTKEPYRIWTSAFSESSDFETDWKVGSRAIFGDGDGYGLIGKITQNIPEKLMAIEYIGQLNKEIEDFDSIEVLEGVKNAVETYTLTEKDGKTTLDIYLNMNENWIGMTNKSWDVAIVKIKELSKI